MINYGDKMIVDLSEDTQNLLEKVKKELGQYSSDNEVIKDALTYYYSDLVTINRAKRMNSYKEVEIRIIRNRK